MNVATAIIPEDGPEKLGPTQILAIETIAKGSNGQASRYRNINEHPLTAAYEKKLITFELYEAGTVYRTLFDKLTRTGRDSTQSLDRSSSGRSGTPWSDIQVRAIRDMQKIEERMSAANYRIVRKFCGEGYGMIHSVRTAVICHPRGHTHRMIEALGDLANALRC